MDTNPEDKKSKIYEGNWPFNDKKELILSPRTDCPNGIGCDCLNSGNCINKNCKQNLRGNFCSLKEGDIFPEFIGIDQFGDNVNIYDFANQGIYILIELGATWCAPCNTLAAYFAYG